MSRFRLMLAAVPLMLIAGCATPFKAQVNRFQAMPVPQGQSFAVVSADPQLQGSLEFAKYAGLVSQRLAGFGYQPAADPASANLIVKLDYGVDQGRERIRTIPARALAMALAVGARMTASAIGAGAALRAAASSTVSTIPSCSAAAMRSKAIPCSHPILT